MLPSKVCRHLEIPLQLKYAMIDKIAPAANPKTDCTISRLGMVIYWQQYRARPSILAPPCMHACVGWGGGGGGGGGGSLVERYMQIYKDGALNRLERSIASAPQECHLQYQTHISIQPHDGSSLRPDSLGLLVVSGKAPFVVCPCMCWERMLLQRFQQSYKLPTSQQ